jgi:putative alpha-1,2-mannosidase
MASTVYRAFKAPTNYTEPCDGSYMGLDGSVHAAAPGAAFLSDLSEWDISRTQASWLALLAPDVSVDLTNSLVTMAVQVRGRGWSGLHLSRVLCDAESLVSVLVIPFMHFILQHNQSGALPRWPIASVEAGCMTGSHGVIILSDAVVKGVPGVDAPAILKTVTAAVAAEDASNDFDTYGYVPIESSNTVSVALPSAVVLTCPNTFSAPILLSRHAGCQRHARVVLGRWYRLRPGLLHGGRRPRCAVLEHLSELPQGVGCI